MKRMMTVAVSAAMAIGGVFAGWGAGVPVAANGQAKAVIVSNGNKASAEALKKYLDKITGATFGIVERAADAKAGSVIELKVAPVEGLSNDDRGKQGYRLKTAGSALTLTSPTADGLSNAVYGFLNDWLKVRFYSPTVEVVPENRDLTVPEIDETVKPSFAIRGYVYNPGYSHDNWRKNRGGSLLAGYNLSATHSFYTYIPPGKYFKDHPEWYPMNAKGKRYNDGNFPLCGTNAELAKELAKRLVATYDKQNPKDEHAKSFVPCAQGDGFAPCLCPECRKLVKQEGSESAPYILMLNRALEEANRTRPNLKVVTFAYFDTLFPPKNLEVNRNLYIHIVNSSLGVFMAGDNINRLDEAPGQDQYLRAMKAWARKFKGQTDRMSMYEWDTPFDSSCLFLEWPNVLAHCRDIRTYYDLGCIYNINIEGGGRIAWGDLCHWVWMNLFWNAEQDPAALVKDFLNGYYGPKAAPFLSAYLDYVEEVRKDTWYPATTVRWSGHGEYLVAKFFTPEVRGKMKALMDQAVKAAATETDGAYLKRVTTTYNALVPQMFLIADQVKPFAMAKDPATGKRWFLRGGNPENIKFIDPILAAVGELKIQPWNNLVSKDRYSASFGAAVEELKSDKLELAVAPHMRGGIVSATYRGKELFANAGGEGHQDVVPGGTAYSVVRSDAVGIDLKAIIEPGQWTGEWGSLRFYRNLKLVGNTVRIDRTFEQKKGARVHLRANAAFGSKWTLAMPDPEAAVVTVQAGDTKKVIPLAAYAAAGNGSYDMINLAKAAGSDVQDLTLMVPEAADKTGYAEVPLSGDGPLSVRYGRGDGIAMEIASTCAGWAKVRIAPDAKKNAVVITLSGAPNKGIEKPETSVVVLPSVAFSVTDAARTSVAKPEAKVAGKPKVAPNVRVTGPNTGVNELDGAELVWIPAGKFLRGAPKAPCSPRDARPVREIELDGYWIYKHPVTFGEYRKVMEKAGKKANPVDFGHPYADGTMVLLSWNESQEYAELVGASLPTEAQWERAARGTFREPVRYPWGDAWEPDRVCCQELLEKGGVRPDQSFEIGKFPKGASTFGVEDLIGGSFEWVGDWYDADYYRTSPAKNPQGPETGRFKVLKGGDSNYGSDFAQIGFRMICLPDVRGWVKTQFRCAINAPGPDAR